MEIIQVAHTASAFLIAMQRSFGEGRESSDALSLVLQRKLVAANKSQHPTYLLCFNTLYCTFIYPGNPDPDLYSNQHSCL